jgi:hypothetical protein
VTGQKVIAIGYRSHRDRPSRRFSMRRHPPIEAPQSRVAPYRGDIMNVQAFASPKVFFACLVVALGLAGCAGSSDTRDDGTPDDSAPALSAERYGVGLPEPSYSCSHGLCTCFGDDDCNDMFSSGTCTGGSLCHENPTRCECQGGR